TCGQCLHRGLRVNGAGLADTTRYLLRIDSPLSTMVSWLVTHTIDLLYSRIACQLRPHHTGHDILYDRGPRVIVVGQGIELDEVLGASAALSGSDNFIGCACRNDNTSICVATLGYLIDDLPRILVRSYGDRQLVCIN